MDKGTLYLIPSPLADNPTLSVLPEDTLRTIKSLRYFIVEELRTARRFLIKASVETPIDEITFFVFNEHTQGLDFEGYFKLLEDGISVGLLSEAGLPCIADPGSRIVEAAHEAGIRVVPLTGPSSIFLALMASGFNGQNFVFHGYLPVDKEARKRKLREIDLVAKRDHQTQIFIETPYRNVQMFEAIVSVCHPQAMLCIAVDLTASTERIMVKAVSAWKHFKPDIHKKNAVFLLYHT
jgi:16S rRNA (cytidine1402-2'-O)-methyltransferase